jgi:2-haloacid dehalogenase/putative hydrolase of the HAD superfamily
MRLTWAVGAGRCPLPPPKGRRGFGCCKKIWSDEGQKLAQVAQDASPRLQARAPQGPGLRDQQDQPALQGQAGLIRPRAIVWDFGNVIVRWSPATLYKKIFPDPLEREAFLARVCPLDWHAATDRGRTFTENCAERIARYPEHAEAITAWRTRWWEMFSGPIPETEAAIEAAHAAGVPQFGLSNISHETLAGTMALSPAFGRLQAVVASGLEGVMKPEPAIYQLACERFGLAPEEMMFVDDSAANVAGARALGFHVHHFTDPAALGPALRAHGLF